MKTDSTSGNSRHLRRRASKRTRGIFSDWRRGKRARTWRQVKRITPRNAPRSIRRAIWRKAVVKECSGI